MKNVWEVNLPEPDYSRGDAKLFRGDCLDVMGQLPDACVDTVLCDPPYDLGFMNSAWDNVSQAWHERWAREALRVAKPGAMLMAFGGTRTSHRLTCAIEDAGWEVRDMLMWIYGSGFPKSLAIDKAIDRQRNDRAEILQVTGWIRRAAWRRELTSADIDDAFGFHGMAGHWMSDASQPAVPTPEQTEKLCFEVLEQVPPPELATLWDRLNGRKGKPGDAWYEREVVGESENGIAGGTKRHAGADDSYGFEGAFDITAPATEAAKRWEGWGTALKPAYEPICVAMKPLDGTFAQNALKHGVAGLWIDGGRVGTETWSRRGGNKTTPYGSERTWSTSRTPDIDRTSAGRWPSNLIHDGSPEVLEGMPEVASGKQAAGGHRRNGDKHRTTYAPFVGERCEGDVLYGDSGSAARFFYTAKATAEERAGGSHPTVKPLALMRYLAKLTRTPTGGIVLDPFMGSGSTGVACLGLGRRFIGIEREPEHFETATKRINDACEGEMLLNPTAPMRRRNGTCKQLELIP